ncbi:hypothetical protein JCM21142_93892 [Saccharicrinis fermentans DSM 9555 = JCM 21142]|uniref:Uncharacterized protein n=1 Tax=Saccharicrinis fermentans DSM 9555 = JCM 21142 TaxID=869213 RepID=W7YCH6_9BACT|nr:hypothetical protein JCM21142_93892 [Saccharicrinis fermentans DSM 9555 = JCM 21142]
MITKNEMACQVLLVGELGNNLFNCFIVVYDQFQHMFDGTFITHYEVLMDH